MRVAKADPAVEVIPFPAKFKVKINVPAITRIIREMSKLMFAPLTELMPQLMLVGYPVADPESVM